MFIHPLIKPVTWHNSSSHLWGFKVVPRLEETCGLSNNRLRSSEKCLEASKERHKQDILIKSLVMQCKNRNMHFYLLYWFIHNCIILSTAGVAGTPFRVPATLTGHSEIHCYAVVYLLEKSLTRCQAVWHAVSHMLCHLAMYSGVEKCNTDLNIRKIIFQ